MSSVSKDSIVFLPKLHVCNLFSSLIVSKYLQYDIAKEFWGLPWCLSGKESACRCRRPLGHEDSCGEGNGNPFQYSCLGNPMDRGAWWAMVHGVATELDMTEWLNNINCKGVMRGSKVLGPDLRGKASSLLPLSMLAVGFCSYFSSKLFPSPGDLPNPGIQLRYPAF